MLAKNQAAPYSFCMSNTANAAARRLKIVITVKNQTQYFKGNGSFFGRISKAEFQEKLAAGYTIWETVNHAPKNIIQFA